MMKMKKAELEEIIVAYEARRGWGRKLAGLFGCSFKEHFSIANAREVIKSEPADPVLSLAGILKIIQGFLQTQLKVGKASYDTFNLFLSKMGFADSLAELKILNQKKLLNEASFIRLQSMDAAQRRIFGRAIDILCTDEILVQSNLEKILNHKSRQAFLELFQNLTSLCPRGHHREIFQLLIEQHDLKSMEQKFKELRYLPFFLSKLKIELTPTFLVALLKLGEKSQAEIIRFVTQIAVMSNFDKMHHQKTKRKEADQSENRESQWKTARVEVFSLMHNVIAKHRHVTHSLTFFASSRQSVNYESNYALN